MRQKNGAGEGVRTLDIHLGKVVLYQLSYARSKSNEVPKKGIPFVVVKWKLEDESRNRILSGGMARAVWIPFSSASREAVFGPDRLYSPVAE